MKTVTETINDLEYVLIKMPVTQSLMMVSKLSRLLGKDFKEDGDILNALISAMSNEDIVKVIKELTSVVQVAEKGSINFDIHFADRPDDLLPVVGFSLRENILPFFAPKALETLMQTLTANLTVE